MFDVGSYFNFLVDFEVNVSVIMDLVDTVSGDIMFPPCGSLVDEEVISCVQQTTLEWPASYIFPGVHNTPFILQLDVLEQYMTAKEDSVSYFDALIPLELTVIIDSASWLLLVKVLVYFGSLMSTVNIKWLLLLQ